MNATTQTFFQRLSWSPDGLALGVPNAIKSHQHVAAIIARNRWQSVEADLVGHRHPVTVVRFCPLMFQAEDSQDNQQTDLFSVVALGSQDATLSVWRSSGDRPLLVMHDCFSGAVSDLAWTPDGLVLLAASHDGSICSFKFESSDFCGYPVSSALIDHPPRHGPNQGHARRLELERGKEMQNPTISLPPKATHSSNNSSQDISCAERGPLAQPSNEMTQLPPASSPLLNKGIEGQALVRVLPFPDLKPVLTCEMHSLDSPADGSVTVIQTYNVINDHVLSYRSKISRVVASRQGRNIWQAQLSSYVTAIAASSNTVVVGCIDGTLYLLDTYSGALTSQPLTLGGAICHVAVSCIVFRCARRHSFGERLAAITDSGQLGMWNISNMEPCGEVSVIPVLRSAMSGWLRQSQETMPGISELGMNQLGMPLIKLAMVTRDPRRNCVAVYALSHLTWCWSRVDESWTPPQTSVRCQSNDGSSNRLSKSGIPDPLRLQLHSQLSPPVKQDLPMSLESEDLVIPLHQLEACVLASKLNSTSEWAHWLRLYCRRLREEGDVRRLRALIKSMSSTPNPANTALLQTVILPEVSQDPILEPLSTELSESLCRQRRKLGEGESAATR